jgi:hypothetical protein
VRIRKIFTIGKEVWVCPREISVTKFLDPVALNDQVGNFLRANEAFENRATISLNQSLCICEQVTALLAVAVDWISIKIDEVNRGNKS